MQATKLILLSLLTPLAPLAAQEWYDDTPQTPPSARRFHTMSFEPQRAVTVMFGGVDERTGLTLGDTVEYDGQDWSVVATNGPAPRQRHAASVQRVHGAFLVFGGLDAQGAVLGDTWVWDGTVWSQVATPVAPSPRYDAQIVFDEARDRFVLFGGRSVDPTVRFDDTWEFDGNVWTQAAPTNAPAPRSGHAMTFDAARNVAVLFGGFEAGATTTLRDTWEFDGRDWSAVTTTTTPTGMVFPAMMFQRTHGVSVLVGGAGAAGSPPATFVFDGIEWFRGPGAPREMFGRQGHGLAFDSARDAGVLFGGAFVSRGGAVPLADTWELSTEARAETFGHGCASSAGELVLATAPGSEPAIGTDLSLEAGPLPAQAAPWMLFGFSDSSFGGVTLPLELSFAGLPGCGLFVAIEVAAPMGVGGGVASYTLPIRRDADLLGRVLFAQVLVSAPDGATSNPLRLTVGN